MELVQKIQDGVEEVVREELEEALKDILEGAKGDLRGFGAAIAKDAAACIRLSPEERAEVLASLPDQVMAVGELNRLRATAEGWDTAKTIALRVATVAVKVGIAALI